MTAEPPSHLADVLAVRRLSPSLVRVELGGPGLQGFTSLGVPDEGCLLNFPVAGISADPVDDVGRWYTVRAVDEAAGRLTVDLVVHPGGVGGEWAAVAEVGDRLRIVHQNSWFKRPEDARWQLLLGDVVGLPAFGRIIEETAGSLPTTAVIEIPDPADRQPLTGAEVTWIDTPELGTAGSTLATVVRALELPEGPGYVYVAGEAAATRAIRKHLRHERGLPARSYGVVGYWRVDGKEWNRRFRESGADLRALYAEVEKTAPDAEAALDVYEERLDRIGLL